MGGIDGSRCKKRCEMGVAIGARSGQWPRYLVYAGLINVEPINPGTGGRLMD